MRPQASPERLPPVLDEDSAWALVRTLRGLARAGQVRADVGLRVTGGRPWLAPPLSSDVIVHPRDLGYRARVPLSDGARRLLDLCIPLCIGERAEALVVAHLGQSADGRVAVPPGISRAITGEEDVRHMHRLRALSDAVVVGARTLESDDPRLTTRLVPGENPARVVLDPRGRSRGERRLFRDGQARTLVVTSAEGARRLRGAAPGAEIVEVPCSGTTLPLAVVREELARRGLSRLFVEGGGITVSRFLAAGLVARLHLAVAPRIIGTGDPAIELGVARRLQEAPCRRFVLGDDLLFDFELSGASAARGEA